MTRLILHDFITPDNKENLLVLAYRTESESIRLFIEEYKKIHPFIPVEFHDDRKYILYYSRYISDKYRKISFARVHNQSTANFIDHTITMLNSLLKDKFDQDTILEALSPLLFERPSCLDIFPDSFKRDGFLENLVRRYPSIIPYVNLELLHLSNDFILDCLPHINTASDPSFGYDGIYVDLINRITFSDTLEGKKKIIQSDPRSLGLVANDTILNDNDFISSLLLKSDKPSRILQIFSLYKIRLDPKSEYRRETPLATILTLPTPSEIETTGSTMPTRTNPLGFRPTNNTHRNNFNQFHTDRPNGELGVYCDHYIPILQNCGFVSDLINTDLSVSSYINPKLLHDHGISFASSEWKFVPPRENDNNTMHDLGKDRVYPITNINTILALCNQSRFNLALCDTSGMHWKDLISECKKCVLNDDVIDDCLNCSVFTWYTITTLGKRVIDKMHREKGFFIDNPEKYLFDRMSTKYPHLKIRREAIFRMIERLVQ